MIQIHIDESGTPRDQNAIVVCGIVTLRDEQRQDLEAALNNVVQRFVPAKFREKFVVHASEMMAKKYKEEDWPLEERAKFLELVMGLPSHYGASIAVGIHRHGTDLGLENLFREGKLPECHYVEMKEHLPHVFALELCVDKANTIIRRERGESASGVPIYEDLPERRKVINTTLYMIRNWSQLGLADEHRRSTVDAIVGDFQFAKKGEEPLLQFADVCGYGLRRWYANLRHGEVYYEAMGGTADRAPFDAASSSGDIIW